MIHYEETVTELRIRMKDKANTEQAAEIERLTRRINEHNEYCWANCECETGDQANRCKELKFCSDPHIIGE
jgi:hypothetical protein